MGFEPMSIAALAPQASPLTTWVTLLALLQARELQDMGFEPMRIATLRPELSPVTTWVILLMVERTD